MGNNPSAALDYAAWITCLSAQGSAEWPDHLVAARSLGNRRCASFADGAHERLNMRVRPDTRVRRQTDQAATEIMAQAPTAAAKAIGACRSASSVKASAKPKAGCL